MQITNIKHLTADQLKAEGAAAFAAGEEIIAASKARELDGLGLLFFEAGYFERREEIECAT